MCERCKNLEKEIIRMFPLKKIIENSLRKSCEETIDIKIFEAACVFFSWYYDITGDTAEKKVKDLLNNI